RPFPQYIEVVRWQEPTAANRYHSFQLKVQKRFSEGSSFLISYTAAKNITNAASNSGFSIDQGSGPPDTEKRQLEWAVAEQDIPQNLVASLYMNCLSVRANVLSTSQVPPAKSLAAGRLPASLDIPRELLLEL